jgi:hypothetical protein
MSFTSSGAIFRAKPPNHRTSWIDVGYPSTTASRTLAFGIQHHRLRGFGPGGGVYMWSYRSTIEKAAFGANLFVPSGPVPNFLSSLTSHRIKLGILAMARSRASAASSSSFTPTAKESGALKSARLISSSFCCFSLALAQAV